MIAIECFKKYRMIDTLAILILSLFLVFFIKLIHHYVNNIQVNFILSLFIINFLMVLCVLLVRKAGTATLFYFLAALFTKNLPIFEGLGWTKVFLFVFAGIVFEIVFLILKIEVKSVPIDIISGTLLSNVTLPILMGSMITVNLTSIPSSNFLNLLLLFFIVGLIASGLAVILWLFLRSTRFVIRFEYLE